MSAPGTEPPVVRSSTTTRALQGVASGVVYGGSALLQGVNFITPHMAGAVDIMVVQQPDGSLKSTPFYARFGKYTSLMNRDRRVVLTVNGQPTNFSMQVGSYGQAYFDVETVSDPNEEGDADERALNGAMSPLSGYSSSGEDAPSAERSERLMLPLKTALTGLRQSSLPLDETSGDSTEASPPNGESATSVTNELGQGVTVPGQLSTADTLLQMRLSGAGLPLPVAEELQHLASALDALLPDSTHAPHVPPHTYAAHLSQPTTSNATSHSDPTSSPPNAHSRSSSADASSSAAAVATGSGTGEHCSGSALREMRDGAYRRPRAAEVKAYNAAMSAVLLSQGGGSSCGTSPPSGYSFWNLGASATAITATASLADSLAPSAKCDLTPSCGDGKTLTRPPSATSLLSASIHAAMSGHATTPSHPINSTLSALAAADSSDQLQTPFSTHYQPLSGSQGPSSPLPMLEEEPFTNFPPICCPNPSTLHTTPSLLTSQPTPPSPLSEASTARNLTPLFASGIPCMDLSLCGGLLTPGTDYLDACTLFNLNRLDTDAYVNNGGSATQSLELVLRVRDVMYPWADTAPLVVGALAFGSSFSGLIPVDSCCWSSEQSPAFMEPGDAVSRLQRKTSRKTSSLSCFGATNAEDEEGDSRSFLRSNSSGLSKAKSKRAAVKRISMDQTTYLTAESAAAIVAKSSAPSASDAASVIPAKTSDSLYDAPQSVELSITSPSNIMENFPPLPALSLSHATTQQAPLSSSAAPSTCLSTLEQMQLSRTLVEVVSSNGPCLELALCAGLLSSEMSHSEASVLFNCHRLSADVFAGIAKAAVASSELVVRVGEGIYSWTVVAPLVLGNLAFGSCLEGRLSVDAGCWLPPQLADQQTTPKKERTGWSLWPLGTSVAASISRPSSPLPPSQSNLPSFLTDYSPASAPSPNLVSDSAQSYPAPTPTEPVSQSHISTDSTSQSAPDTPTALTDSSPVCDLSSPSLMQASRPATSVSLLSASLSQSVADSSTTTTSALTSTSTSTSATTSAYEMLATADGAPSQLSASTPSLRTTSANPTAVRLLPSAAFPSSLSTSLPELSTVQPSRQSPLPAARQPPSPTHFPSHPRSPAALNTATLAHSSSSQEQQEAIPILPRIELSLCGSQLYQDMSYADATACFDANIVGAEVFSSIGEDVMMSADLTVRISEVIYPWSVAAPLVMGTLAFGSSYKGLPSVGSPCWLPPHAIEALETESAVPVPPSKAASSWSLWPFGTWGGSPTIPTTTTLPAPRSSQRRSSGSNSQTVAAAASSFTTVSTGGAASVSGSVLVASSSAGKGALARADRPKTLTPTRQQLATLGLRVGQNTITFKVGKSTELHAYIYLLPWRSKIVVSDIDGTITRSDLLGHILPAVGVDWSHPGIAKLLSDIQGNGYMVMYLSSRAITQANVTRAFINALVQGQEKLPVGPVIISPQGLLPSLYREIIVRRSHEFKIAALQEIRSLFPSDWEPFCGGFGNRDTDEKSYKAVGVPDSCIFIINPKGELRGTSPLSSPSPLSSLLAVNSLLDTVFPPLNSATATATQQDQNSPITADHSLDTIVPDTTTVDTATRAEVAETFAGLALVSHAVEVAFDAAVADTAPVLLVPSDKAEDSQGVTNDSHEVGGVAVTSTVVPTEAQTTTVDKPTIAHTSPAFSPDLGGVASAYPSPESIRA